MVRTAFAFDPYFREQGFDVLPDPNAGSFSACLIASDTTEDRHPPVPTKLP